MVFDVEVSTVSKFKKVVGNSEVVDGIEINVVVDVVVDVVVEVVVDVVVEGVVEGVVDVIDVVEVVRIKVTGSIVV